MLILLYIQYNAMNMYTHTFFLIVCTYMYFIMVWQIRKVMTDIHPTTNLMGCTRQDPPDKMGVASLTAKGHLMSRVSAVRRCSRPEG